MTVADNVWETTTTTGTGTITLAGAVSSDWQTFVTGLTALLGLPSPDQWTDVYYVIFVGEIDAPTQVEVGKGTVDASAGTLTRADVDVTYSTTSNNRISLPVGTANVICSMNAAAFNQF